MNDIWDESGSSPFWGDIKQLQKLSDLLNQSIKIVIDSESIREIVLESWIVLDYAVRDLLVSGFGLYKYCNKDFDLRGILLPISFRALIKLLRDTINYQSGLNPKQSHPNDYPPYTNSSYDFLKYLKEKHPKIVEKLKEIETEFFINKHPELADQVKQGQQFYKMPPEDRFEGLPSGWIEVVSKLGDDWFADAESLNKARNEAAHSYDQSTIAEAFGIHGSRSVELVRNKCRKLLKSLFGIT